MANRYRASIHELRSGAAKTESNAEEFKKNYMTIFKVVEELVQRGYVSPDAMVTAKRIVDYKPDMDNMYKAMLGYANYANQSANATEATQQSNVDGINY